MRLFFAFALLLFSQNSYSQDARLKIFLDPSTEKQLLDAGFELDHGILKPGVFIESDFTAAERNFLDQQGIRYQVVIDHIRDYYASRKVEETNRGLRETSCAVVEDFEVPENFILGSMGGFFTYEEMLDHLDSMATAYPNLITLKQPIDTFLSIEGRPIYWVKISDNPAVDESEPEVLYTAVHHAREPVSMSQLIFYMYYLLENYGSDEEVTHLVNNREIYFVPLVNPDGYIYNQTTDPNGGGLWRKNRRQNANGTFGVDLNRNYGEHWGHDNSGSSPNPGSETFRGSAPFSEPETRAIQWFCEQHNFKLALNYHAYGNYVIYPWGYVPAPLTPDSMEFIAFADMLTEQNQYTFGTGYQTVGYPTNGDSDDWMYGEQTLKNKIFSMTPEIGNAGDGFWPAQNRIIPLCLENLRPNLLLAHFSGEYAKVEDASQVILDSQYGHIRFSYQRLGIEDNNPPAITLHAVSGNIDNTGSPITPPSIALAHTITDSISYTLSSSIEEGEEILFELVVDYGSFSYTVPIRKVYGTPATLLSDIGSTMNGWDALGNWNTTATTFFSPPSSITDSPAGEYPNNSYSTIELSEPIDLSGSDKAVLMFQAKWDIEQSFDYAQIEAVEAGQNNWEPLCGLFTKSGSEYQDQGNPVWDGTQNSWVQEQIDLDAYLGKKINIRFVLKTDQFVTGDGFYFDDFTVMAVGGNLGTDEKSALQAIKVFPNPTNGKFWVGPVSSEGATFELFTSNGQKVRSDNLIVGKQNELDLGKMPEGVYYYRISAEGGAKTGKVVLVK